LTYVSPVVGFPGRDVELRYGYSMAQLHSLAVFAVRHRRFIHTVNFDDCLGTAWSAMAEHLYTSPTPPHEGELLRVGWRAISDWAGHDARSRGQDTHDRYAGTTRSFAQYWRTVAGHATGPEDRVVDRVALWQIWARLGPRHREALAALAVHEDFGRAAEALGKSRGTFKNQVGQARQEFLRLWHDGEQPSRLWGRDRRRSEDSGNRHTVTNAIKRRKSWRAAHGKLPA
jgi:hypothetical protein